MAFNTLSTRILLVILIVYSGSFNHCFAQDTEACSTSVTGICGAPGSHVSETPQGVIDGRNSTFRIRLVPSNDSEITVFRNGLKLIRGVDYQVTGQLVTTSPTSTPAPGDVLELSTHRIWEAIALMMMFSLTFSLSSSVLILFPTRSCLGQ